MTIKNISICLLIVLFLITPILPVLAEEFDPNIIVSDEEINDYNSMTLQEIENFLTEKGSFLSNYVCEDISGKNRKASEVIYTLAQENKINPKFMLVLLQKEQSLIEDANPSDYQLTAATGYGCPDSGGCNPRWKSFYKQVNSAYLQFRSYIDEWDTYRYQPGKTYIFNNSVKTVKTIDIVTPKNPATAALYNYTPHVYYGNYNFWKIWNKYFPEDRIAKYFYPDGSLLQVSGEDGVYLIQNNEKRPFLSKSALMSRYSLNKIVSVDKKVIDSYTSGTPIRFPNYSILQSTDKKLYLLVGDVKREIPSMEIFNNIGFNKEEIIEASDEELQDYINGVAVSEKDAYPTGALLQDKKTGGVYFVINSIKYPIWSKSIMIINYPNKKIIPVTPQELAKYTDGGPAKINDGELIKDPTDPMVYVISNGQKRAIANEKTFLSLGYKWSDVSTVNNKIMEIHPTGKIINIDNESTFSVATVK